MKVAIVIPDGISALLFCKGIVYVLKKNIPDVKISILSEEGECREEIEKMGVRSVSVAMHRYIHPVEDIRYLITLTRIMKKEKFDMVINFSTKSNIYGSLAASIAGTPKIISHVVGLGTGFMRKEGIVSATVRGVLRRLYKIACSKCQYVWFTNRKDVDYFMTHGLVDAHKIIVTNNYLDTDYYTFSAVDEASIKKVSDELAIEGNQIIVLMVARLIWPKGIKEFCEAAEDVCRENHKVRFLLVAPEEPGNPDAVPVSYVKEMEEKAQLKWLGFQKDVRALYAVSDVVVLPSYYNEGGFPRGITEGMSMGKPVITSDSEHCKGTIDVGRNGYIVPIKDSQRLAETIKALVSDERKMREFGIHSRVKAVSEYDEQAIIQKVVNRIL